MNVKVSTNVFQGKVIKCMIHTNLPLEENTLVILAGHHFVEKAQVHDLIHIIIVKEAIQEDPNLM